MKSVKSKDKTQTQDGKKADKFYTGMYSQRYSTAFILAVNYSGWI